MLPALLHFMAATSSELMTCRCRATETLGLLFDGLAATCPQQLRQLAPTLIALGLKVGACLPACQLGAQLAGGTTCQAQGSPRRHVLLLLLLLVLLPP